MSRLMVRFAVGWTSLYLHLIKACTASFALSNCFCTFIFQFVTRKLGTNSKIGKGKPPGATRGQHTPHHAFNQASSNGFQRRASGCDPGENGNRICRRCQLNEGTTWQQISYQKSKMSWDKDMNCSYLFASIWVNI